MSKKPRAAATHGDTPPSGIVSVFSILLFLVILLIAVAMIWDNPQMLQDHRFVLPILIGMIAFASLIMTIVYCFRVLSRSGMASKRHAFALPPGSIRAILAMGFIVLVMVFGVYLITEVKTPQTRLLILSEKITAAEPDLASAISEKMDQLRQIYGQGFVVADETGEMDDFATVNVYMLSDNDRIANLAQQILTMLATALTAIVGFYFGSRTANEPEQTNAMGPTDIAPPSARVALDRRRSRAPGGTSRKKEKRG